MKELILPDLILLDDYSGNFATYNQAVFEVFRKDFIKSRPTFNGTKLRLKKHPYVDGKEYTYYHFTHSGDVETERIPDFRRMERISFPRPMIDNSNHKDLRVWRVKRGSKNRILILSEKEKYLIVLEDRVEYILPWTAYFIEYPNKIRRLIKEYEAYKNTETA
jgi:hypothetical protein